MFVVLNMYLVKKKNSQNYSYILACLSCSEITCLIIFFNGHFFGIKKYCVLKHMAEVNLKSNIEYKW